MVHVQQEQRLPRATALRRPTGDDRKRHLQIAVDRFSLGKVRKTTLRPLLWRGPGWTNNVAFLTAPRVPSLLRATLCFVLAFAVLPAGMLLRVPGGRLGPVGVLLLIGGVVGVVLAGMGLASTLEYRGHAGSLCVGNVVAYLPAQRDAPPGAGAKALLAGLLTYHGWTGERLVLRAHAADPDKQQQLIALYEGKGFVCVPGQADGIERPFYVREPGRFHP